MSFKWTEESKKKLSELWSEGLSASKIGAEMGISKNSVIGAAHRMKLTARASPIRNYVRSSVEKDRTKKDQPTVKKQIDVEVKPVSIVKPPRNPVILTNKLCCFPVGDPKKSGFRFCGKMAVLGKPYCAACCEIAYIRPLRAA